MGKARVLVPVLMALVAAETHYLLNSGPSHTRACNLFGLGCVNPKIHGHVDEGFDAVKEAFERQFRNGRHVSASVSVWSNGKQVVDLWGGYKNSQDSVAQLLGEGQLYEYTKDSLNIVYSSTKVLSSVVIAMAVDRGLLDYDTPIATYWPKFGKNGKEAITVADLMRHRAGLSYFDVPATIELMLGEGLSKAIEDQPRTSEGMLYHALTRDIVASELLRRVDPNGRDLSQFALEEIAKPLGIEWYVGMPETHDHRFAPMYRYPILMHLSRLLAHKVLPTAWHPATLAGITDVEQGMVNLLLSTGSPAHKTFTYHPTINGGGDIIDLMHTPEGRKWPGGSHSGYTNAENAARLMNVLAHGGSFDGVTLMGEETFRKFIELDHPTFDQMLGKEMSMTAGGLGLMGTTYGWGGYGGSAVRFNPETKFAISFVMNQMDYQLEDERAEELIKAAYTAHMA